MVDTKIEKLQTGVLGHASALINKATVAMDQNTAPLGGIAAPAATKGPSAPQAKPLLVHLPQEETSSLVIAQKVLEPILSPLTTLGIVLVVVIFLLMQGERGGLPCRRMRRQPDRRLNERARLFYTTSAIRRRPLRE